MSFKESSNVSSEANLSRLEAHLQRLNLLAENGHQNVFSGAEEINLVDIWKAIWKSKILIISITTLFAFGSIFLALYLPNIYQSKTLLAPSEDAQGGGVSRMAGQLGGLASLAGINLTAGAGVNKVAVAVEVLKSRDFITSFINRHEILPELMAVKSWNPITGKLTFNDEIYDDVSGVWVREVEEHKSKIPTSWEAYKEFQKIFSVSQDKETGFITVSIEHKSPVVAEQWVRNLVMDLNRFMKEKDVKEARKSIEFLDKQLSVTALADMRTVFYQLIEEQTKTIMLAEVRDEYVFSTIDPPVIAEEKYKPRRALICIVGVLLGGILAVMLVVVRYMVAVELGKGRLSQS